MQVFYFILLVRRALTKEK